MLFSSLIFIYLFLPVTLFVTWLIRPRFANAALFAASIVFCAWAGVSYSAVLLGSVLVNYFTGRLIGGSGSDAARKRWFILGIIMNLGLLVIFKYANFITDNISFATEGFGFEIPPLFKKVILPIGLSFYTFKALTYIFSVYRKECPPEKNFITLALYISFFAQLPAGPIDRFRHLAPQIRERKFTIGLFESGVRRFALGFAKKVIIAGPLALMADQVFSAPEATLDAPYAWLGLICYALQIYFDFSGYTDMAIGVGRMFGFRFTENFNFPYISQSVKEFWKRWHITLSTWFRDYLFLPVAYSLSRKMKKENYAFFKTDWILYACASLVTFLLCGLWHGAAWNFVIWGAMHGIFLALEHTRFGKILRKSAPVIRHIYFILFILLSWVFFRIESLTEGFGFTGVLFTGWSSADWVRFIAVLDIKLIITLLLAIAGCTPLFGLISDYFVKRSADGSFSGKLVFHTGKIFTLIFVIAVMFAGTLLMISDTSNPFIYFKF